MNALLGLSRLIDSLNERVGRAVMWLVFACAFVSAANAVVRKVFSTSSNAFLEAQWYMFSAIFLLAAGYTLMRQEHVRIDLVVSKFSKRTQIKLDMLFICIFLMPVVYFVITMVMPLVIRAFESGEMSNQAGGLIRWPVYALVPIGFALLGLQGVSEFIKRWAYLKGLIDDPTRKASEKSAEQELAEAILAQQNADKAAAATATAGERS
ncbi:TRAP transporter small permease subunit [Amphibiibacter pelophylacis]|uniref:TRAP transporter small permease subunit n=1 Tax=Amphibiibacter pelophylacis TaxID=1799477 RepID=A0ACC6P036_9BURK